MRKCILLSLFAMLCNIGFAQYKKVDFNYEKSTFNNGQPLPAETYFELTGDISKAINIVEIQIYDENGYPSRKPLYQKLWKRPFNHTAERFVIPLNYNLRGDEEYDFAILYFKKASETEITNFRKELFGNLDAYLDQNFDFSRKRISLLKDTRSMVDDMNQIVTSAMSYYRTQINREFEGFSDLVKDDIERVENSKQNRMLGRKSTEAENLARKNELINALKTRVHAEVAYLLNSGLQVLVDIKHVDNYKTEKTQTVFTLHGGYGGAYFDQSQNNNLFGQGIMAGVTLPLGKAQFASPFWSNTSIMMGVYFNDFQLNDNITATGPLLQRPYYLGVGYKVYRFLRVSAGATLLENNGQVNGREVSNAVYVRPYISLTADINLWIGLAK